MSRNGDGLNVFKIIFELKKQKNHYNQASHLISLVVDHVSYEGRENVQLRWTQFG